MELPLTNSGFSQKIFMGTRRVCQSALWVLFFYIHFLFSIIEDTCYIGSRGNVARYRYPEEFETGRSGVVALLWNYPVFLWNFSLPPYKLVSKIKSQKSIVDKISRRLE